MQITNDIRYIGVNDHEIDLFEGQFEVPLGMAYNSYVILDEKVAVMDSVDIRFGEEWLANLKAVLGDRKPDYLVVSHMEPDHSANLLRILELYPETVFVGNKKTFDMMERFYGPLAEERKLIVGNGDTLSLGKHELQFILAPMVHWPEVMVTFDKTDKVLFSADAFGKFGANDVEDPEGWSCEARRYYFGIVGKYGVQAKKLLDTAAGLGVETICPLHGPVLSGDLSEYLGLYEIWTAYRAESEGVFICYTSVYGHTKEAALLLKEELEKAGCPRVAIADLAREDYYECIEDAFRHSKLVLASTTYNAGVFPIMENFIRALAERGYKNRVVGIIENGTWAPAAARTMKGLLEGCKEITFAEPVVTIPSAMGEAEKAAVAELAKALA